MPDRSAETSKSTTPSLHPVAVTEFLAGIGVTPLFRAQLEQYSPENGGQATGRQPFVTFPAAPELAGTFGDGTGRGAVARRRAQRRYFRGLRKLSAAAAGGSGARVVIALPALPELGSVPTVNLTAAVPGMVTVVLALENVPSVMRSLWQQAIMAGSRLTWEEWLRHELPESDRETPSSVQLVMAELLDLIRTLKARKNVRLVLVVGQPDQPQPFLDVVDTLFGASPTLSTAVQENATTGRSFVDSELEMLRRLNISLHGFQLNRRDRDMFIDHGAIPYMRAGQTDGVVSATVPEWAVEQVAELTRALTAAVAGVETVGDVDALCTWEEGVSPLSVPDRVPSRSASRAMAGVLQTRVLLGWPTRLPMREYVPPVESLGLGLLLTEMLRRTTSRMGRVIKR